MPPRSVFLDASRTAADVLAELGVPIQRPVLVLIGMANGSISPACLDEMNLLLRKSVVPALSAERAVVVTGGTQAGVMHAIGVAVRETGSEVTLVGVAPHKMLIGLGADESTDGAATPEPSHLIVTTPGGEWGDEGTALVQVAETIAEGRSLVVLAIGGGKGTTWELDLAERRKWPVLLVTGLGEESASDRAAQARSTPLLNPKRTRRQRRERTAQAPITDREAIGRGIRWVLSDALLLKDAWSRFAVADHEASRRKRPELWLARIILFLAVLTALSVIALAATGWQPSPSSALQFVLKLLVTALPLVAAILLGLLDRSSRLAPWLDLRASAESAIQEIYRYRANASPYEDDSRDGRLVDALTEIDLRSLGRSMRRLEDLSVRRARGSDTGWGSAPFVHWHWPPQGLLARIPAADDLLGPLQARVYDSARVLDQLVRFETGSRALERRGAHLAAWAFALSAAATLFMALSWRDKWWGLGSAVAASLVAALVSWREFRNEGSLSDAMNTTAAGLRAARGRWLAGGQTAAFHEYVAEIEDLLAAEGSEWGRMMRQAQAAYIRRHSGK